MKLNGFMRQRPHPVAPQAYDGRIRRPNTDIQCGTRADYASTHATCFASRGEELLKLRNSERAEVPPEKLRDYLLSPGHPVGRFKARYFRSLGYTADDWESLAEAFLDAARVGDAEEVPSPYGRKFMIVADLQGGAQVVTIWILETEDAAPRFVTAYPLE